MQQPVPTVSPVMIPANYDDEIKSLNDMLHSVTGRLDSLETDIGKQSEYFANMHEKVTNSESFAAGLNKSIQDITATVAVVQKSVKDCFDKIGLVDMGMNAQKNDVKTVNDKVEILNSKLAELMAKIEQGDPELKKISQMVQGLNKNIDGVQELVTMERNRVTDCLNEIGAIKTKFEDKYNELDSTVQSDQKSGIWKLILTAVIILAANFLMRFF
jgi:chromosome segregation ATPase